MNQTAKRTPPLSPSKLKVGDRVTESYKNIDPRNPFAPVEVKEKAYDLMHSIRIGTVKEVFVKTNAAGARRHYASVLWDGFKSTAEHEQSRLMVHVASQIKQEKGKVSTCSKKNPAAVEILNLDSVKEKELFTARTETGYVGCVRLPNGICFTPDVFPSALEAANKARSLKKLLEQPVGSQCKETKKNTEENKKYVVKENVKKVALNLRLYTLEETKAMPLLRFQEVWVIIKNSMYVSSCLDKERRSLVNYTSSRDKALYFTCHEKAKMTMRVLKGTVGPGFDLKRFFIENK